MYRGEARLNFPERWPGDDSSRYAGVARNADAVTTRAPWRAHHDSHELGSFDDEKVARSERPPLALGYVYLYARK